MNEDTKTVAIVNLASWGGFCLSKWLSAIGVHTWGDFSGMCASIVSLLFVADWIWKRIKRRMDRQ